MRKDKSNNQRSYDILVISIAYVKIKHYDSQVKGLCFLDESLKFKPIKNTIKRSKPINSRKDSDLSP